MKKAKIFPTEKLPPIIMGKGGKEVQLDWPRTESDKEGRYLPRLAGFSTGYHRLITMGWKRIEDIANA